MRQLIVGLVLCITTSVVGAQSVASRLSSAEDRALLTSLVAREDSRTPYAVSDEDPRVRGLISGNAYIRAFTVRGLGDRKSVV